MAIQPLNTIKNWFKTGLKPSQNQFWDTWDSFRHKFEKVPMKDIQDLESILDSKSEKSDLEDHKNDPNAHSELFEFKENKSQKGVSGGYAPLDEFSKIAYQYLNIIDNLTSGGATSLLSAEQGMVLQKQLDVINLLLKSDNPNMNTIQKIVDTIEEIQLSLNTILVNDLTTGGVTKALTAEMGKILQTNKEDKSQKGVAGGYVPLNEITKIASEYLLLVDDLITGGSESILSAEQGKILQNQINTINTLLQSDNVNLDTIQEIADAIKQLQISLNTILINDLTTGGTAKALTAEMGKHLNLKKLTATLATDDETQITAAVAEDNKVVSRSTLFNWWNWVKKSPLKWKNTISASPATLPDELVTLAQLDQTKPTLDQVLAAGDYAINKSITLDLNNENYQGYRGHMSALGFSGGYGIAGASFTVTEGIQLNTKGSFGNCTFISEEKATDINRVIVPNRSGTIVLDNDFITTAAGTIEKPSLKIPTGNLTTVPQEGAIERDSNSKLWTTRGGSRYRLLEDDGSAILLVYNSPSTVKAEVYAGINASNSAQTIASPIGAFPNTGFFTINMFNRISLNKNLGTVMPNVVKLEAFIQINNGFFYRTIGGPRWNQLKIYEKNNLTIPNGKNGISFFDNIYSEVIETAYTSWSAINLPLKTDNGSTVVVEYTDYSLTNASNNADLPASQASFSFVFTMTLEYADSTNASGQNVSWKITNENKATYIEKIR